jgi:uncharacterized membrane protein
MLVSPGPGSGDVSRIDQLAERGTVDSAAPVVASGTIVIDAPAGLVWDVLADVVNWPSIRSDIGEVTFDDVPRRGSIFAWSTAGVALRSRFGSVEPASLLTWSTVAPGLDAVHVYRFEAIDPGHTRILAEESMTAPAAPYLNNAILGEQIRTWLEGLKARAEGRA